MVTLKEGPLSRLMAILHARRSAELLSLGKLSKLSSGRLSHLFKHYGTEQWSCPGIPSGFEVPGKKKEEKFLNKQNVFSGNFALLCMVLPMVTEIDAPLRAQTIIMQVVYWHGYGASPVQLTSLAHILSYPLSTRLFTGGSSSSPLSSRTGCQFAVEKPYWHGNQLTTTSHTL